jgi:hypothetical protein
VRSSLAGTDKAQHSPATTLLDSVRLSDLPGIGITITDGIVRTLRSHNTPPATKVPVFAGYGHRAFRKKHSAKDGLAGAALIQNNARVVKSAQVDPMKISDIACPSCGSLYLVAESVSASAGPGHANCTICGKLLASWQQPSMRVYRLELSPELKYPRVEPSPSP